ncbi:hypothetical protein KOI35_27225 [Actinoplanes bogorensis]|uniref:Secreted protein n=1 Tax=Paractinoplanes bogorensis TaxID=1610840 RepID=A0ABS5YVV6_9ACTN|nr:hypothetical protein [Actinoplanes bogorensis]MBU2667206.1 hypothetical protein [Actinoplanes bogorensis]
MEALIGLFGVAVGWLLGYLTDRQKQRAEARNAAKIIYAEILGNQSALQRLIHSEGRTAEVTMRRLAWDTYGVTLLRIADDATLAAVVNSYNLVDLVPATVKYFGDRYDAALTDLRGARDELRDGPASAERGQELAADIKREVGFLALIDDSRKGFLADVSERDVAALAEASKLVRRLFEKNAK